MDIITTSPSELVTIENRAIDQNPAAAYLASLSTQRSKDTMKQALNTITDLLAPGVFPEPARPVNPSRSGRKASETEKAAYQAAREVYKAERAAYNNRLFLVGWAALEYQHVNAIRAHLAEQYAPKTANRLLSALRGVLENAFLLGQMSAEVYQKARMVKNVTGETVPAGRELSAGELLALMQSCEDDLTPAGARDAAIIAMMYAAGLRRAEIVALDLADYNQETGALKVFGKRRKERIAYLVNGAALAMADWLAIRGDEPGALFHPINKGGVIQRRRMTNQAIYNLLAKRGEQARVKDFSPHDMRRTFVSDLLEKGADIATVAKMAGHANVQTTARYDRRPEQAKQKAAGLLHIPYNGRLV